MGVPDWRSRVRPRLGLRLGLAACLRSRVIAAMISGLAIVPATGQIRFEEKPSPPAPSFTLRHSPTASKRMIETMAGGLAVFDYDGDGLLDVFFTNGASGPSLIKVGPEDSNRLFRNLGQMRFEDVSVVAGVTGGGYSMGAAVADFDDDGDSDLFVAGVFENHLYRNRGDGTFEDITEQAGIESSEWAVAAGWFDFDQDSLLDLFVVNYADWTLAFDRYCGDRERGLRVYCHPKYLTPIANRLYRNLGDGRFEAAGTKAGLDEFRGRGMSAAFLDVDGDGFTDVFVTNDNLPNFLLINEEGRRFVEDALLGGIALLDHGRPVASMGVDSGDFNGDGTEDVAVTALSGETFPLFRGDRTGSFRDQTVPSGLARATRPYSGWGNAFADLDNDGDLDLLTANSHVNDLVEDFEPYEYRQRNTAFPNLGERFGEPVEFGPPSSYRGLAAADLDRDGLLDVVVTALGEPARVFRNVSKPAGSWLAVRPVGSTGPRDALGTRISVGSQTRWIKSAVGYASATLRPAHFGLGSATGTVEVRIEWPSGRSQTVSRVPVNTILEIREEQ